MVVSKTLEVNGASKRKFNGERREKEGIEASREKERQEKRLQALNDCGTLIKKEETSLTFMARILSGGASKKPEEDKQERDGTKRKESTSGGDGREELHKRVRARPRRFDE